MRDYRGLERIIVEDNIDWVVSLGNRCIKMLHEFGLAAPYCIFKVNFAALLSAISEKMPELAYEVNVGGSKNMLDLGKPPEFNTHHQGFTHRSVQVVIKRFVDPCKS